MNCKIIGYCRVSTVFQSTQGVSLEMQIEKIKAYCKLQDLDLVDIVIDSGISAKNLKGRPQATEMIERAIKGGLGIVVYKLDRMFRNVIDALSTIERLDKASSSFHSITERLDTSNAMGRFLLTLTASFAELERGVISERTSDALQSKIRRNEKTGGEVPFGFDLIGDGKLKENLQEQKVISLIASLSENGFSYRKIAQKLEALEIKTKKGKLKWNPKTIMTLLKRKRS
jgi:site-specific DNA recombinase